MDELFESQCQESETEWAEIERLTELRRKKDKRIISEYCAKNKNADIIRILTLLEKFNGLPSHDKDIINEFKNNYPNKLTVRILHNFEDVKDIYSDYLECGEEDS